MIKPPTKRTPKKAATDDRPDLVRITVDLPADLWAALRNEATRRRTTLRAIVLELLERERKSWGK